MDAEEFGRFISDTRRECGMTQAELAEKLKVTDKAISRWERGRGFPDISLLEPLAQALGISLLELMHSQKTADASTALTEQDAAELVRCAGQIAHENFLQEKTAGWISAIVTIVVGAVVVLTGHGNIGGGLVVGALCAVPIVALYYYAKNRDSKDSRRIYGAALEVGAGIVMWTMYFFKVDSFYIAILMELFLSLVVNFAGS